MERGRSRPRWMVFGNAAGPGDRRPIRHRCFFALLLLSGAVTLSLLPLPVHAQKADTWVATDGLGRTLPTAAQTRPARSDRFVGIFYFLTHGSRAYYDRPQEHLDYNTYGDDPRILRDNTQIIAAVGGDPVTKPEGWKVGGAYWWGQPAVGYFLADDPWVARRNLTMLADAGVDTLIFDVTNAPQYAAAYTAVLDTAEEMRREGHPTPQFLFITYSSSGVVANSLYDAIYSKGRYKDLWFLWHSKPLILGDPNGSGPDKDPPRPEVQQFFTWRYSWANTPGPSGNGKDEWQWIDTRGPQQFGWDDTPKVPEEVPVALGGWSSSDLGRSYQGGEQTGGKEPPLTAQELTPNTGRGLFFAQQWESALKTDPEFIFVTGWNEWTAGRQSQPGIPMLGRVTKAGQYFFVDEYNEEFSRDAMPMKGGYADNYYMQLAAGIRRFKGVHPVPETHDFQTPKRLADWQGVFTEYAASGAFPPRDWPGWGGKHYADNSGRNAILAAKVACDAKNIYFYVRTQSALTSYTGKNWMQLLLDTDQNPRTGWNGYDYVVNNHVLSATQTTLKRLSDGRVWTVPYILHGSEMQVTIPRALLGSTSLHRTSFDFHWADNVAVGGDPKTIADWWYIGSSAPDGRFNYRFTNER